MYNFHICLFIIIFRNYVSFSNIYLKFIKNNKLNVVQIIGRNDYYTFFNG
jgi:hypothetical protein